MKATYQVFDILRKGKTENCQHALEGILMVVDPIHCIQLKVQHRMASTRTSQRGPVCLGSANIQGLVLVRAMMQAARDA
jgi:hypothetical protein